MKAHDSKMERQRARELEDAGHVASALIVVRGILEVDPDDANALFIQGQLLGSLARYAEAEHSLCRAQELFNDQSEYAVHAELGHLYEDWGRLELALASYEKAVLLRPGDASGYINAGAVLARLGRFEEAAAFHQRGTECSEGCVDEAHHNLGLIFRAQERFADAVSCFESALAIDPAYEAAQVALADVLQAQKLQRRLNNSGLHLIR